MNPSFLTHPTATSRNPSKGLRWLQLLAVSAVAALLVACASKGINPVTEMATARAAVAQAENAGAREAAPVELLAARDNLVKADAAVREERFEPARRLAVLAETQAQVAERKARAVKAQNAAAELQRSNELLQKELDRKNPS
jgi:hypothetical protein